MSSPLKCVGGEVTAVESARAGISGRDQWHSTIGARSRRTAHGGPSRGSTRTIRTSERRRSCAPCWREAYAVLHDIAVDERMGFVLRFVPERTRSGAASTCRMSLATVKRWWARAERQFLDSAEARRLWEQG